MFLLSLFCRGARRCQRYFHGSFQCKVAGCACQYVSQHAESVVLYEGSGTDIWVTSHHQRQECITAIEVNATPSIYEIACTTIPQTVVTGYIHRHARADQERPHMGFLTNMHLGCNVTTTSNIHTALTIQAYSSTNKQKRT